MELNDKHIRKSLYTNDCIQWFFKYVYQNAQNMHYNNTIVEKFNTGTAIKTCALYLCLIKISHLYRLKILCTYV